ncbi:hypothetical protein Vid5_gp55 [Pantoea phage vB_PagS_Vid5]|uniref:Uncharacterized protein n=1 Tax=Pantoea phage vB_PagS_Vid5 TaxID=2099652 RepID=A0A2P1CKT1_9CAUD|nr:hypothetical protein FDJ45_gp055 [Pantoea phage vB_PagS_Vid5]AVJ51810.1 hypothetical protein Vid5_gp55 [Pantoea phage vB_PagS_Vid5]
MQCALSLSGGRYLGGSRWRTLHPFFTSKCNPVYNNHITKQELY